MPSIKRFAGLNNVARLPELAGPRDLQVALNVCVDDDGALARRPAFTAAYEGPAHSVNAESGSVIFIDDEDLIMMVNGAPTTILTGLTAGARMAYLWLNDRLYGANGTQRTIIANGVARSWGIAAPPKPTLAQTDGGLDSATYQVALTYVRDDGQESPASETALINVTSGGIAISNIQASVEASVIGIAVYVTGVGGETRLGSLRLAAVLRNINDSFTIVDRGLIGSGQRCLTLGTSAPPAGTRLFFHGSRLFVVSGPTVWWSLPYMYEHVDLDRNFMEFQDDITAAVPVDGGIWFGTASETMLVTGKDPMDPGGLKVTNRLPHGVACGVAVDSALTGLRFVNKGPQALLVTSAGVLVGDGEGKYENITDRRWAPGSLSSAFAVVDRAASSPRLIFDIDGVTHFMNIATGAVTTTDKAFNSASMLGTTLYAADADGVHAAVEADVDTIGQSTAAVAATIKKGGLTFGANNEKLIDELYLIARTAAEMSVTVRSGANTGTYTTDAVVAAAVLEARSHKCRPGRGLRGRAFELTVQNVNGAMFDLTEIDINVTAVDRRHARQMHG